MSSIESTIAENLHRVRRRIEAACQRSGRDPESVRLVAVTKYAEWPWLEALLASGVTEFAESRPQQLVQRAPRLPPQLDWHLIGHLQRNKVRSVLPIAALIHSVDTIKLLERIDLLAQQMELVPRILVQVNVSAEPAKDGFPAAELIRDWESILAFRHLQVDGLMTMAPRNVDSESARPVFQAFRQLRDRLLCVSATATNLTQLSMGMSGDFEVAIEEGATLIRVGRSLFEGLQRDA